MWIHTLFLWKQLFIFFLHDYYTDLSGKCKACPKNHLNSLKTTLRATPFSYMRAREVTYNQSSFLRRKLPF